MPTPSNQLRCLITAGPTREFIDPVRFISNPSSGKMGYALADQAHKKGWSVDLISGPVSIQAPSGVNLHKITTSDEMFLKCQEFFETCDILIMCAAVSDMKPKKFFDQKQKKGHIEWTIEFEQTVDILKTLSKKKEKQLLVGFAAETQNLEAYAKKKLEEKRLDWIVANNVSSEKTGFGSDLNSVEIFSRNGYSKKFGPSNKDIIAKNILDTIL